MKNKCINCKKEINKRSKRCYSCANKIRKYTQETRDKISLKAKKRLKNPENNPMFGKNKYKITQQMLIKEYTKNEKSSNYIAKMIGCNSATIFNYLRKYKILIRSNSKAQKLINRKGKNNSNYIDGRKSEKYYCIEPNCNNEIKYNCWKCGESRCKSCAGKLKMKDIDVSKENNPNWQGGIGKLPYPYEFNNVLKEKIRKRDNYKCQLCGCLEVECNRKLDVHHIDYDKENCKENNLISLCNRCNILVNFDRDYYYAYFMYIMEN